MLAAACATPVRVTLAPPAGLHLRRIALVPFLVSYAPHPGEPLDTTPAHAADLVTAQVLESLASNDGLQVVPPSEVAPVLAETGFVAPRADPRRTGQLLRARFDADAYLTGTVRRFRERVGGPEGATSPASVWLDLELRGPEGELLWRGIYEETQRSLSDNLLGLGLAWDRGFRWLTAEELALYGARTLVARLSQSGVAWK
jgi:hypothetical protein